jgi:hypothetical protein
MTKPSMTFSEMIQALETATVRPGGVPGTTLTRSLKQVGHGMEWVLSLGEMTQPKREFRGAEIQDVVEEALRTLVVN